MTNVIAPRQQQPGKGRYQRVSGPPSWVAAVSGPRATAAWPALVDGPWAGWDAVPRPRAVDPLTDTLASRLGWQHMPVLRQQPQPGSRCYGRPRLADVDPFGAELVAYAKDIRGEPVRAVARELDLILSEDAARAQARRYLSAGRVRLHERGVLPWVAWLAGKLPAAWWASDEFMAAVAQWNAEAATAPVAGSRGGPLWLVARKPSG